MKTILTTDNINQLAAHIITLMPRYTIFTFIGPLGAGKTTLIKEILRQSGVTDIVTSPTFGYVNTYHNPQASAFHHFDLYRIASAQDFIYAGFDEYLQQEHSWSFIEWPGVIENLLKQPGVVQGVCQIAIDYSVDDPSQRTVTISP